MRLGILVCASVSFAFVGCSIHPIPDDRVGDTTVQIVKKIRCETRLAVEKYASNPRYKTAAIAYDFRFTVTENNRGSGAAAFAFPLTNGRFSLNIGAGEDKQRIGVRNFQIVETFAELKKEDCSVQATDANYRYPITGIVGLEEVIGTFVKLNDLKLLEQAKGPGASYVDALEFATIFRGSVEPAVELSPVADRLRLTQGRVSFGADRGDVHRLTLSLSIPIKETRAPSGERSGAVVTNDEAKERALNGLERFKYFETQQKILDSLRDAPLR
jgi:hypothetical protein